MSSPIEVVAAVIRHEGKFLCVQRGKSKYPYVSEKFEFPGGKVEAGETQLEALKREISEELEIEIHEERHLVSVSHQYPDFSIVLHAWLCQSFNKEIQLKEHISMLWLLPNELHKLDWAAADLPVVEALHLELR
jgi:8-oxo-dGTP diphosphatase